jgi:hypothetical protein
MSVTDRWIAGALAIGSVVAAARGVGHTGAPADDEASNVPHVAASAYGRCYAKAVPDSLYGQRGRTTVYWVRAGADSLLATHDWYSQRIYLECNVAAGDGPVGLSVVRMGPWARGQVASAEELALAFYRDGKLLRRYSTLAIAGRPDRVRASVSHYVVIDSVLGYRWVDSNRYQFVLRTVDGRQLAFDPATGERITRAGGAR